MSEQIARCEVCGWPLAESRDEGCVQGDCSYRPDEGTDEWYRIRARRDALKIAAAERAALEAGLKWIRASGEPEPGFPLVIEIGTPMAETVAAFRELARLRGEG